MTWQIGLNTIDEDFADKFRETILNFFKLNPTKRFKKSKIKNWNDQYIIKLCSKEVCKYINFIGNFKQDTWIVPHEIKNSDNKVKAFFLRGFFDSEEEFDKNTKRVGSTSMNLKGLNKIGKLLNYLDIRDNNKIKIA